MTSKQPARAISLVARLLQHNPEVDYIRLRRYPGPKNREKATPPRTLKRALRHERGPEVLVGVPTKPNSREVRRMLAPLCSDGHIVGFCSQLETQSGRAKHALLTAVCSGTVIAARIRSASRVFERTKSPNSLAAIEAACRAMGYTGWLLDTEWSYRGQRDARPIAGPSYLLWSPKGSSRPTRSRESRGRHPTQETPRPKEPGPLPLRSQAARKERRKSVSPPRHGTTKSSARKGIAVAASSGRSFEEPRRALPRT